MRRDVRLLGEVLGEVLRDSGGQSLLDDVERLRRGVIAARAASLPAAAGQPGAPVPDPAGDEIAAMVAAWPLDRAELVARAFTVYFHLVNLAEEQQRIRTLAQRDSGKEPLRESLAAAVAEVRGADGMGHLDELLGRLRVHPVLTAHPTEARRRAVTAALRRIGGLLAVLDDPRPGASGREETMRRLREETDLLWRTSPLRVQAMTPLDEVRAAMTAFDDTLFRVVPAVYRSLDQALLGTASGTVPPRAPAFIRLGSWVGADRDGNPFVTAQVTVQAAEVQADHVLRALENAAERIGRALTVHEPGPPPARWRMPWQPRGWHTPRCCRRSRPARRRSHTAPTCCTPPRGCAPPAWASPDWPTAAARSSSQTCAWCSGPWRHAPPGRRSASCST